MRALVFVCLLGANLLVTSCADISKQPPSAASWNQRVEQLSALTRWSASGKLAIRTEVQSQSASLDWQQDGHSTHILLTGPLGLGATAIDSDRNTLQVSRDGSTKIFDISSAVASEATIGWDLPLQQLPFWIRGLPSPETPIEGQVFHQNLLRQFQQEGWTITCENYSLFDHFTLPTRVTVERSNTRARIIIRNWSDFSS
ncbi:MAG: outer membrane lipoprotein LolB [Halioglobus sp.]|jgi:outer membrane lipoprotein LolB